MKCSYLDTNLLVHAGLSVSNLLLELLQRCCVRRSSVGLEHLNVALPASATNPSLTSPKDKICSTYSSVRGVIFLSVSSSSKFFRYFSQFSPVALGMVAVAGGS